MNGTIKAGLGVLGLSLVVLTWQVIGKREAPVGGGSGLVYRVEYGGGTHYVAASFHLLKKSDYPLPIPYATAFEAADELVFELGDEAGRGRDETVEKFFTAGKYVGDQSLKTELPGEVYSKLAAAEKRLGLTAGSLDGYRPWLAALTLATAKHRSLGALSEFGMEGYFESLAREGGKGISGLESVEAQIGLFAGLSEEESAELLDQTLAEVFLSEERTFYLVRAWRRGDANEVDRFLGRGRNRNPRFYERTVDQRNQQWLKMLVERMSGPRTLMVLVGAGHVVGDSGLISLLEKNGATVTQMTE